MAALGGKVESRETKGEPAHGTQGLEARMEQDYSGRRVRREKPRLETPGPALRWGVREGVGTPAVPALVCEGRAEEDPIGHNKGDKEGGPPRFEGPGLALKLPHLSVGAQAPEAPSKASSTCSTHRHSAHLSLEFSPGSPTRPESPLSPPSLPLVIPKHSMLLSFCFSPSSGHGGFSPDKYLPILQSPT